MTGRKCESAYNFYDMESSAERIAEGINVSIETVQKWLADREAMPTYNSR